MYVLIDETTDKIIALFETAAAMVNWINTNGTGDYHDYKIIQW